MRLLIVIFIALLSSSVLGADSVLTFHIDTDNNARNLTVVLHDDDSLTVYGWDSTVVVESELDGVYSYTLDALNADVALLSIILSSQPASHVLEFTVELDSCDATWQEPEQEAISAFYCDIGGRTYWMTVDSCDDSTSCNSATCIDNDTVFAQHGWNQRDSINTGAYAFFHSGFHHYDFKDANNTWDLFGTGILCRVLNPYCVDAEGDTVWSQYRDKLFPDTLLDITMDTAGGTWDIRMDSIHWDTTSYPETVYVQISADTFGVANTNGYVMQENAFQIGDPVKIQTGYDSVLVAGVAFNLSGGEDSIVVGVYSWDTDNHRYDQLLASKTIYGTPFDKSTIRVSFVLDSIWVDDGDTLAIGFWGTDLHRFYNDDDYYTGNAQTTNWQRMTWFGTNTGIPSSFVSGTKEGKIAMGRILLKHEDALISEGVHISNTAISGTSVQ